MQYNCFSYYYFLCCIIPGIDMDVFLGHKSLIFYRNCNMNPFNFPGSGGTGSGGVPGGAGPSGSGPGGSGPGGTGPISGSVPNDDSGSRYRHRDYLFGLVGTGKHRKIDIYSGTMTDHDH